jgi:hypothetical protein
MNALMMFCWWKIGMCDAKVAIFLADFSQNEGRM